MVFSISYICRLFHTVKNTDSRPFPKIALSELSILLSTSIGSSFSVISYRAPSFISSENNSLRFSPDLESELTGQQPKQKISETIHFESTSLRNPLKSTNCFFLNIDNIRISCTTLSLLQSLYLCFLRWYCRRIIS